MEEKSTGNYSKVNHNDWIQPKKCMPTTYFTKSKNKEEHDDENDECNMFVDANNNQRKELLSKDEKKKIKNIMQ